MQRKSRKSAGVKLAGMRGTGRKISRRGTGVLSDIGKTLLNTGKQLIRDNGPELAANLAKAGATALINKTMGSGYKVTQVKVVKRR